MVTSGDIQARFPDAACEAIASVDWPTFVIARTALVDICRFLRDERGFGLLVDLTAVDYLAWPLAEGPEPRFAVVYHVARIVPPVVRLRLKVRVASGDARVPTVSAIWPAAGWLEREVYDLFGIVFDGHPDLRRLLLPEDWEGHPLRKDYPVQVDVPVRTTEPRQLTVEEFRANLERDRAVRRAP